MKSSSHLDLYPCIQKTAIMKNSFISYGCLLVLLAFLLSVQRLMVRATSATCWSNPCRGFVSRSERADKRIPCPRLRAIRGVLRKAWTVQYHVVDVLQNIESQINNEEYAQLLRLSMDNDVDILAMLGVELRQTDDRLSLAQVSANPEEVLSNMTMLSVQVGRLIDCTGLDDLTDGGIHLMSGMCTLVCATRIELSEFLLPEALRKCPTGSVGDQRLGHSVGRGYISGKLAVRLLDQILYDGNVLLAALESRPSWCF